MPDVTYDLETLDLGTSSKSSKGKKKSPVVPATNTALKKGVEKLSSSVKRKQPVEETNNGGPGPVSYSRLISVFC
jgi:hypothetical protein